jgi:hypothetical protein
MRRLKDAGVEEVMGLRRRTLRSAAMGRIGQADCQFIVKRLDEVHARIIEMQEDDDRREF